jgi:hypothetical protein
MTPPPRLINGEPYIFLGSFSRIYADGLARLLHDRRIPYFLETPFTNSGLTESYLGTYLGDVSLWVPQVLLDEVELLLERDFPSDLQGSTTQ